MREVLKKVCRGCQNPGYISEEEAYEVFKEILDGKADPVHISAFFTGLRMRGESKEEFEGIYRALRERVKFLEYSRKERVDLAVSYDGKIKTLHILPSAIFIALSCGVSISSHGTRGVPAKFGNNFFEVISLMTGRDYKKEEISRLNNFLYADQYLFARDLYNLLGIRNKLGFRTFINVIEKVLNPFNSSYVITSVAHNPYFEKLYYLCQKAGFERIMILKGVEGGVEPYPDRKTKIMINGEYSEIDPAEYGLKTDLPAGNFSLEEQAEKNIRILEGKEEELGKWAILTASLIIYLYRIHEDFGSAIEKALFHLSEGKAYEEFKKFLEQ